MRLFVAIDLPQSLKDRVAEVIAPLREAHDFRWAKADGFHLTVVFLGETEESERPALEHTLDTVAARHARFTLELGAAGTFGTPKAPRVLWLGVEGQLEPARALQADVSAALEVVEDHPVWTPHLTLARARKDRGEPSMPEVAEALGAQQLAPFTVEALTLFETRGGHYFALHRAPLR